MKKYSGDNSVSELVHRQGLYFGNNPDLTMKELKEIIRIINHSGSA
jgi:hypothetical protein